MKARKTNWDTPKKLEEGILRNHLTYTQLSTMGKNGGRPVTKSEGKKKKEPRHRGGNKSGSKPLVGHHQVKYAGR